MSRRLVEFTGPYPAGRAYKDVFICSERYRFEPRAWVKEEDLRILLPVGRYSDFILLDENGAPVIEALHDRWVASTPETAAAILRQAGWQGKKGEERRAKQRERMAAQKAEGKLTRKHLLTEEQKVKIRRERSKRVSARKKAERKAAGLPQIGRREWTPEQRAAHGEASRKRWAAIKAAQAAVAAQQSAEG